MKITKELSDLYQYSTFLDKQILSEKELLIIKRTTQLYSVLLFAFQTDIRTVNNLRKEE